MWHMWQGRVHHWKTKVMDAMRHRQAMDKLVEQLIEQETMDGDEFRSVVAEFAEIPDKERFSPILA